MNNKSKTVSNSQEKNSVTLDADILNRRTDMATLFSFLNKNLQLLESDPLASMFFETIRLKARADHKEMQVKNISQETQEMIEEIKNILLNNEGLNEY